MNYFAEALAWLANPSHQAGPSGIWARVGEHLWYTVLATGLSCVIGVPLGYLVGHTHRARWLVVQSSGTVRALPTLGLLTLFGLLLGIGLGAPLLALVVLAVPSVLAGAYAGVEGVNPRTVDAARAQGMTELQILARVEIPLGLPLLLGGIRSAAVQVCATATLAAYVGAGGLGRFLFLGLKTQNYAEMLAASILVVAIALVLEIAFQLIEVLSRRLLHAHSPRSER